MADDDVTIWFNPSCSKCRGARDLLDEHGVSCELVRYLEDTPSRDEIERVLKLLGTDDPRTMMRTGEDVYKQLGLAGADRDLHLPPLEQRHHVDEQRLRVDVTSRDLIPQRQQVGDRPNRLVDRYADRRRRVGEHDVEVDEHAAPTSARERSRQMGRDERRPSASSRAVDGDDRCALVRLLLDRWSDPRRRDGELLAFGRPEVEARSAAASARIDRITLARGSPTSGSAAAAAGSRGRARAMRWFA